MDAPISHTARLLAGRVESPSRDGVYPDTLNGEPVWAVVWKGEKLGLVWGDRDEADVHYLELSGRFVPIDRRIAAQSSRERRAQRWA